VIAEVNETIPYKAKSKRESKGNPKSLITHCEMKRDGYNHPFFIVVF
jgi:hypothetical protein